MTPAERVKAAAEALARAEKAQARVFKAYCTTARRVQAARVALERARLAIAIHQPKEDPMLRRR